MKSIRKIQIMSALVVSLLITAGCADKSGSLITGLGTGIGAGIGVAPEAQAMTVVNQMGTPIASAQILLGDGATGPLGSHLMTVDSKGTFAAPSQWTAPTSVTISAPGYVRTTFMSQTPNGQTFALRAADSTTQYEITGQTTGYDIQDNSGTADVGMVISAFSKQDVFNFQLGMIVSPQKDQITVAGRTANIPSNISIPTQTQTYIFPVKISKPIYRTYVGTKGSHPMFVAHAQFPVSKVIDDYQNKVPVYQLVNDITLVGGTLQTVNVTGASTTQDLNVTQQSFSATGNWQIPAIDSTQVILAMSLNKSGNVYFPTGIHEEEQQGTGSLSMMASGQPYFVAVLKNKSEFSSGAGSTRLSAALAPFTNSIAPTFLPLLADPVASVATEVQLAAFGHVTGVTPLASYAVLSLVNTDAQTKAETTEQLWAIYDPNWSTDYKLPTWPGDTAMPSGTKRWDLTRLAVDKGPSSVPMGPAIFEVATHASHASVDLKVDLK